MTFGRLSRAMALAAVGLVARPFGTTRAWAGGLTISGPRSPTHVGPPRQSSVPPAFAACAQS
jgi:hypothetical protein